MTVLGLNTPVVLDSRSSGGDNIIPIADSLWESAAYFPIDGQESVPVYLADYTLATGETMWFYWPHYQGVFDAAPANYDRAVMQLVGLGADPQRAHVTFDRVLDVRLNFTDANSGASSSAAGTYSFPVGAITPSVLEVKKDSSTQVTLKFYVVESGVFVTKITHVHTNAGGVGTLTFKQCHYGLLTALAKGEIPVTMRVGPGKLHNSLGSGSGALRPTTTSRIQATAANAGVETGSHPTGIPEEAEWRNTGDTGAAAVADVDDPWNTALATRDDDTAQSTSTTLAKTQSFSFPTSGLSVTEMLAVQFLAESIRAGLSGAAEFYLVLDDGTESALDAQYGRANFPVGAGGQGAYSRLWTAMPGGGAFTQANIDAANFKARKAATGIAANVTLYDVNRLLYYEPAASATRRRSGQAV